MAVGSDAAIQPGHGTREVPLVARCLTTLEMAVSDQNSGASDNNVIVVGLPAVDELILASAVALGYKPSVFESNMALAGEGWH
jgi:hypothetical protein